MKLSKSLKTFVLAAAAATLVATPLMTAQTMAQVATKGGVRVQCQGQSKAQCCAGAQNCTCTYLPGNPSPVSCEKRSGYQLPDMNR